MKYCSTSHDSRMSNKRIYFLVAQIIYTELCTVYVIYASSNQLWCQRVHELNKVNIFYLSYIKQVWKIIYDQSNIVFVYSRILLNIVAYYYSFICVSAPIYRTVVNPLHVLVSCSLWVSLLLRDSVCSYSHFNKTSHSKWCGEMFHPLNMCCNP